MMRKWMTDAHTHLDLDDEGLPRFLESANLTVLASASLEECERLAAVSERAERVLYSAGVHPWDASRLNAGELSPGGRMWNLLRQCPVIGEIGMDREWCEIPLDVQQEVFTAQLDLAQDWGKPVVLHTKGCEAEIAKLLEERPGIGSILVHWYSGSEEELKRFQRLDCYFSIGSDVRNNAAVKNVVKNVRLDRILIETDGVAAVEWAAGRSASLEQLPEVLEGILDVISEEKNQEKEQMREQVNQNFVRFLESTAYGKSGRLERL